MQSVEGTKVVVAPKPGGKESQSLVILDLSGKASVARIAVALEEAKTPHAEKSPPGVVAVIPGKLKPSATSETILTALKKAELTEE
jgi:hypothetical protein